MFTGDRISIQKHIRPSIHLYHVVYSPGPCNVMPECFDCALTDEITEVLDLWAYCFAIPRTHRVGILIRRLYVYIDIYIYIILIYMLYILHWFADSGHWCNPNNYNPNLDHVKLNQLWILITLFLLMWHRMEFRLVPNQ